MGSGERDRMLAEIRRLARGGRLTILLVEHDMDVVFGMATRIVVLHQARCWRTALRSRSGRTPRP